MGSQKTSRHDSTTEPTTWDLVRRLGPPVLLVVVALLFVVQNTEQTSFDFLWFQFEWPLWVMLVVFALVGAAISWFLARRRRRLKDV